MILKLGRFTTPHQNHQAGGGQQMLRLVISAFLVSYAMTAQTELPFNPAIGEG